MQKQKTQKKEEIKQKIKSMQKELNCAIANSNSHTSELIELSQEIDKLIVDFYLNSDSK